MTRDLKYIAVRLDAVHRLARDPEVRSRVTTAKTRLCGESSELPSREDITAALNPVEAHAAAVGDRRAQAAALTVKRWAAGTIAEAECNVLLGLGDDAPGWPTNPTREDIAAKLDEVYELAKAQGDSGEMAAARLSKLRLYGQISEAEYRSWLGEDEAGDG